MKSERVLQRASKLVSQQQFSYIICIIIIKSRQNSIYTNTQIWKKNTFILRDWKFIFMFNRNMIIYHNFSLLCKSYRHFLRSVPLTARRFQVWILWVPRPWVLRIPPLEHKIGELTDLRCESKCGWLFFFLFSTTAKDGYDGWKRMNSFVMNTCWKNLKLLADCKTSRLTSRIAGSIWQEQQNCGFAEGSRCCCRCLAALFTAAGEDVSVGGCDTSPTGAVQPHRLQLGCVRTTARAGAPERLFEHRAEGDERVRASGAAAVALTARQ